MYRRVNEPHLTHKALLLPQSSPPSPPTDTSSGPGTNDRQGGGMREQGGEELDTAQVSWPSSRSPVTLLVDDIFHYPEAIKVTPGRCATQKTATLPYTNRYLGSGVSVDPFVPQVLPTSCDRN